MAGPITEQDPFLSLSGDEFDAGLLDGLDEMGGETKAGTGMAEKPGEPAGADSMPVNLVYRCPQSILSQEADEILKGNAPGLGSSAGLKAGTRLTRILVTLAI